ncbi:hypothetical protein EVAR_32897_1 [Eumeta japonica]|uniref:Uncharacterized protein n=1 Tax=Eumeta variegata TaxID=151549 RepID=A0A4C1VTE6_EUMVA|nr:hypothetical protein EVAR_32897_1 [Eumeta japonica]
MISNACQSMCVPRPSTALLSGVNGCGAHSTMWRRSLRPGLTAKRLRRERLGSPNYGAAPERCQCGRPLDRLPRRVSRCGLS